MAMATGNTEHTPICNSKQQQETCGFLEQQYTWFLNTYSKTCWIVLKSQILFCYETIPHTEMEKENNFVKLFNLKNYDLNIKVNGTRTQFELRSKHANKYTLFIASSEDDMSRWVNAIKRAQNEAIDEQIIKLTISFTNDTLPSFSVISLNNTQWSYIIEKIEKIINERYFPLQHHIKSVDLSKVRIDLNNLFGNYALDRDHDLNVVWDWNHILTCYEFQNAKQWRYLLTERLDCHDKHHFAVKLDICLMHQVHSNTISCKFITNGNDPLQCAIYSAMKTNYIFNEKYLQHLLEYAHFEDEFHEREACRYGLECKSFVRLETGGNKLADRCHLKLYTHPPRNNRQIRMAEGTAELILSDEQQLEYGDRRLIPIKCMYDDDEFDRTCTLALIAEVINNGYKNDLFVGHGNDDDTKSNDCSIDYSHYTIMQIVEDKLRHPRHKQLGSPLNKSQILALILYTGCDCNYDLCKSQRKGDYKKWQAFDYCLYKAISMLSEKETGSYKVYTGLSNVKLSQKDIHLACFPTYVSTSWIKEISVTFIGDEGMIIEIDELSRKRLKCCDVSWISKFSDECEILIARSIYHYSEDYGRNLLEMIDVGKCTRQIENTFNVEIVDEQEVFIIILKIMGAIF
eukprot:735028_1